MKFESPLAFFGIPSPQVGDAFKASRGFTLQGSYYKPKGEGVKLQRWGSSETTYIYTYAVHIQKYTCIACLLQQAKAEQAGKDVQPGSRIAGPSGF